MNASGSLSMYENQCGNAFSKKFQLHIRNESLISELHFPGSIVPNVFSSEFSASNLHPAVLVDTSIEMVPSKVQITIDDSSELAMRAREDELRVLEDIFLCGHSEGKRKAKGRSKDKKDTLMVEISFAFPTSGV